MKKNVSIVGIISILLLLASCSNQKNTQTTRLYHEINTRYNIYFNAEQAYIDALEKKNTEYKDNLSEMIYMYPYYPDEENKKIGGFETTIDKCVKAIKLHSIQVKPERNPSKRGNIAYQEWLSQREFNPFLKNAWLLMAKAEYQSLDYLRAITTFSYITRLFKNDDETVTEARLWIANAYLQMDWIYEAENVFRQIELAGVVPEKHNGLYAEVYANFLIKSKKYEEAIPYLEKAIKEQSGNQSMRFKYLLAQVYAKVGNRQKTYEAFGKVGGLNTPYEYSLSAKLQQAQYINPANKNEEKKVLSSLNRMTKNSKNEEYLDQIFLTIGNIHLQNLDTLKAIDSYSQGIQKSTRNGYDKAISQIKLGDIFFTQKDYIHAQPLYPEALGVLGKRFDRYQELMLRSEVLDKLVVYAEAIHLQDSLQTLARMPENERMDAIDKIIADLKKKEEEDKKDKAREEWAQENAANNNTPSISNRPTMPSMPGESKNNFYFYNSQTVAQGKTLFRKQWGNRKLEDNWRRKDKSSSAFGDYEENIAESDTQNTDSTNVVLGEDGNPIEPKDNTNDVYAPEFYLSQIPLTPEALQESNDIVEDALFNMGVIYKNDLGDLYLAIDAFDSDVRRFPNTPNLEEIYYQLFLIYSQLGNKNMAEIYRGKLLNEFPSNDYAKSLLDPNYEYNLRNMAQLENNLYQETYDAYMAGNTNSVRKNYALASEKYSLSKLMPKFSFLNALSYAQTDEPTLFRDNLKALVEKYPDADVTPVATEMLKGLLAGKPLGSGGPVRGMLWSIPFGGGDIVEIDTISRFKDDPKTEHLVMLIFDPLKVKKNDLIYNVADYNFSNFVLQTFDLSFSEMIPYEILQVKGFSSLNDITEYTNNIFEENSLLQKIDSTIIIVPISTTNYSTLSRGKSLGDYFEFFKTNYGKMMPKLVAYWSKQVNAGEEAAVEETVPVEEPKEVLEKKEDQQEQPFIEIETDSIGDIAPIEIHIKPRTEGIDDKIQENAQKIEDGLENVIPDETINDVVGGANDINDALDKVAENPVDGIKSIISSIKNRPKLTKEEKAAQKEEKKRQKELEKLRREKEKAAQDSINAIEKARQDSIDNIEKEKKEFERAAIKAKEDARKDAQKAKEDARKEREQQLKEKERARKEELKRKETERKEKLKEKEKARKEKEKQRQTELREKEKQARSKRSSR